MSKPSYEELERALLKITAIAHFGGHAQLSEEEAMRAIRRVTLPEHFRKIAKEDPVAIRAFILK